MHIDLRGEFETVCGLGVLICNVGFPRVGVDFKKGRSFFDLFFDHERPLQSGKGGR